MPRRVPRAPGAGDRPAAPHPVVPRVHVRGDRRLDGVIDFVAAAVRPVPLGTLLDEAPRRVASIVEADVASVYLLEGEGNALVMRGNVGFPGSALGRVRLAVGEGITGTAVECMRPISVSVAPEHGAWRAFPELGEERYPVFAAVPVLGRSGPLGALVVQRRVGRPFTDADVELLVALSGTIAARIHHAEVLDALRDRAPARRAGGGTRKVTLTGRPVVEGRALGALAALRRPPSRSRSVRRPDDARRLRAAFDAAASALDAIAKRAREMRLGRGAAFLATYLQIAHDARLRDRALDLVAGGAGLAEALGQVAREAVRAATGATGDPYLEERARDIEDLCDAVAMLAATDPRAALPTGAVLVGDQVTVFDLLVSSRARPSGIALSTRAAGPRAQALLRLLGVPAIADVEGLFRWASDGDVALLDAVHGLLVINPSRAEVASVRKERRGRGGGSGDLQHAHRPRSDPHGDRAVHRP